MFECWRSARLSTWYVKRFDNILYKPWTQIPLKYARHVSKHNFLDSLKCTLPQNIFFAYRIEVNPVHQSLGSFGGNLFSSLWDFLNVRSISVIRWLAEYSDLHLRNDLQFCFVDISNTLMFHLDQVYASLYHGSLALSRIIFCKVVNKTLFYLANNVPWG